MCETSVSHESSTLCYWLLTQKVLLLEYEYHLVHEDIEEQMTGFQLWCSLTVPFDNRFSRGWLAVKIPMCSDFHLES